jgi:hypothetical protein
MSVVHVAEAGENRGRVVLRLESPAPNRVAVEAALRIARAFQSELESVFVEDQQLIDCAAYAEGRVISFDGRAQRPPSKATVLRQMALAAREAERRVAAIARIASVPYRARTIRDDAVKAVCRACSDAGPWNVVALAEPVRAGDRERVLGLVAKVDGATGVVMVGPIVRRTDGSVLAVIEDVERLMPMLRTAERLAADTGARVVLLLIGESEAEAAALEARARLALAERTDVDFFVPPAAFLEPAAVAEAIRRVRPGFVVGHAGGALLPPESSWRHLVDTMECPVFVVR